MPVAGAIVAAVATVGAAKMQSDASKKASKKASDAAEAANDLQYRMFDESRQDLLPWRLAGTQALADLSRGTDYGGEFMRNFSMADYEADPGYQFRREEGTRGIERRAAARGRLGSGATLRELARYNSGLASDEYGNAFNRYNLNRDARFNKLGSLAGIGQTATSQQIGLGQNLAGNVGQNLLYQGQVAAQGQADRASTYGSALGQLAQLYGMYQGGAFNSATPVGQSGYMGNAYSGGQWNVAPMSGGRGISGY